MDEHDDCASDCEKTAPGLLADLIGEEAPADRFTCALCFKAQTHARSLPKCKHILCYECLETIRTTNEADIDKEQATKVMETDDASQSSSKVRSDSESDNNDEVKAQGGDDGDYARMPPVTDIPDVGDLFGMMSAIDPILQREAMTDPFMQRNADTDDYMRLIADGFPFAFPSQQSMSSQGSVGDIVLSQTQDAGSSGVVAGRLSTHQTTDEAGVLKIAGQRVICPVCQVATIVESRDIGDAPNTLTDIVESDLNMDVFSDLDAESNDNQSIVNQTQGLARCSSDDCGNPAGFYCQTECGYLCSACEKHHKRFIYTKLHDVKELNSKDQLSTSTITTNPTTSMVLCNSHPHYRVEFVCMSCPTQIMSCLKCIVESHREHKIVTLSEGYAMVKGRLLNQIEQSSALCDKLDALKSTSTEKIKRLLEAEEQTLGSIQSASENYIKKLEAEEQDVISSALSNQLGLSKNIQLDVENINSIITDAQHRIQVGKDALDEVEHTNEIQALSSANDSLTNLIKRVRELPEPDLKQIRFRSNSSVTLQREADAQKRGTSIGKVYLWNPNKKVEKYSFRPLDQISHCIKAVGRSGTRPLEFDHAWGICVNPQTGNVYVADQFNHRIQVLSPDLEYLFHFGKHGGEPGCFNNPISVCVSPDGEFVVVTDNGNHRLQVFLPDGEFVRVEKLEKAGGEQFRNPINVAIGKESEGYMYVTDTRNERVYMLSRNGELKKSFGKKGSSEESIGMAEAITITEKNEVCVLARGGNQIFVFDSEGEFVRKINIEAVRGRVSMTWGPDGTLWIADSDNHQVVVYSEFGEKLKVIGTSGHGDGQFTSPMGISFGPNGRLYVCDYGNSRIQVF